MWVRFWTDKNDMDIHGSCSYWSVSVSPKITVYFVILFLVTDFETNSTFSRVISMRCGCDIGYPFLIFRWQIKVHELHCMTRACRNFYKIIFCGILGLQLCYSLPSSLLILPLTTAFLDLLSFSYKLGHSMLFILTIFLSHESSLFDVFIQNQGLNVI